MPTINMTGGGDNPDTARGSGTKPSTADVKSARTAALQAELGLQEKAAKQAEEAARAQAKAHSDALSKIKAIGSAWKTISDIRKNTDKISEESARKEAQAQAAVVGKVKQIGDAWKTVSTIRQNTEKEVLGTLANQMALTMRISKEQASARARAAQETERESGRKFRAAETAEKRKTAQKEYYEKYLRNVRMTSMKWEEDAKEKARREEEREEETKQQAKASRRSQYAKLARTTAYVLDSVHGDFEGLTTAAGAIAGAAVGGPSGAALGEVAGEIVGKLTEAIVKLPLAPGNLWKSFNGMTQPYTDLQRSTYALGRAGGFGGQGLLNGLMPGKYGGATPMWMQRLGVTPESAVQSVAETGISPQSGLEAVKIAQNMALAGYTGAFSNLSAGQQGAAVGQGMSYGAADAGGIPTYLRGFATTLETAVQRGADKSRVFGSMMESIDALAKGGAGGISSAAMSDLYMRFLMAGTPGGRSGESAAGAAAGIGEAINNAPSSLATSVAFMQIARKNGGLTTEDSVTKMYGEQAVESMRKQNPAYLAYIMQQGTAAAKSGNLLGAQQIFSPLQALDPNRFFQQTSDLYGGSFAGAPGALAAIVGGATHTTFQQAQEGIFGGTQGGSGAASYDVQMSQNRVLAGLGTNEDVAKVLRAMKVPEDQIPLFIASARKYGVDPVKLATLGAHESGFKQLRGRDPNDLGIMQVNTSSGYTAAQKAALLTSPAYEIDEGARIFKSKGQDFQLYYGRATAANGKDPHYGANRQAEYERNMGFANVPTQANQMQAMAAQDVDTGAQIMFNNLGGLMVNMSKGATAAAGALRAFADDVDALARAATTGTGSSADNHMQGRHIDANRERRTDPVSRRATTSAGHQ